VLSGLRKLTKATVGIVGVPAEIRNLHILNANQKQLLGLNELARNGAVNDVGIHSFIAFSTGQLR